MGKIKGWVWVLSIILLAGGRYVFPMSKREVFHDDIH